MASFREKNGSWEYIVSAGKDPVTNKYIRITKSGFRTKTEARHAAHKVEEELRQGTYVKESNVLFGDFVEQWLAHYGSRAKISSVRARRIATKRLLDEWEHYTLSNISMSMYQQHIDELSTRFSKNYIESIHSTGKMIFAHAEKLKMIRHNPTKHFEMPRMLNDEVTEDVEEIENFLDADELAQFLHIAKTQGLNNDYEVFVTLAYTGLRIGELLALKHTDINYNTNEVSISKTYYNPNSNKKEFTLLTPKNRGSVRRFELDAYVIELIKSMREQQDIIKLKNSKAYQDQDFIFADAQGYPYTIRLIATRLQRLMKIFKVDREDAQQKHITPHSFRHTHISLLIEANVHIGEIQRRVGHKDINTTLNLYTHMTRNTKKQASDKLTSHLSGLTEKLKDT